MRGDNYYMTAEKAAELGYTMSENGTRYHGRPCQHGHDGWRFCASRQCVECNNVAHRARYARKKAKNKVAEKLLYGAWA